MPDKITNFLFLAEPFGFGPISSSIAIARQIKKLDPSKKCLFLGRGTSHQLAAQSRVFDQVVLSTDATLPSLARAGENISPDNCVVIANTYPGGVAAAKQESYRCVFIDTLFWMWNEIPVDLDNVETYYIEDFHCIEFAIDRFGKSNKFRKTPPLIDVNVPPQLVRHPFILVSLGGIDSDLYDFPQFYDKLIEHLSNEPGYRSFEILICGGGCRISRGDFNEFEKSGLSIKCLEPLVFMAHLQSADFVLSSPGLHGFYESYYLQKNTMFLPPQSYSQYLQLKYILKSLPKVVGVNFENLNILHSLRENMPTEERISEVKRVTKAIATDEYLVAVFEKLHQFCTGQIRTDWSGIDGASKTERLGPEIIATELLAM
jgi:hypothetical protein